MRVWLAAFVLLFAIIELVEWFAQLGSWQPTGMWLVLGGMALAALSNANHLPRSVPNDKTSTQLEAKQTDTQQISTQQTSPPQTTAPQKATSSQSAAQLSKTKSLSETKNQKIATSLADESDKDSISFKVRPLKR